MDNRLQDYLDNKAQVHVNVPQNNVQAYNQEVMNRINQGIQQPQGSYWNGVATGAVTGTAEGVFATGERIINGLTNNKYGQEVDYLFNNAYSDRQNRLQQQADFAGIGGLNKAANVMVDVTSGALGRLLNKK